MGDKQQLAVILLAAGQGVRLGGQRKFDLTINGMRYLDHLVTLFADFSDQIIVAISEEDLDLLTPAQQALPCKFVVGGATRQISFEKALAATNADLILVHEVARPLVSPDLISKVIAASCNHKVVVAVVQIPVRDSLALHENGQIKEIIPRDKLVLLQTPQIFQNDLIQSLMTSAAEKGWVADSLVTLARKAGIDVFSVTGEETNIKVTYPEDIPKVDETAKRQIIEQKDQHEG